MPSAAQTSRTRRSASASAGISDRVGRRLERCRRASAPGRRSRGRWRAAAGPRRRAEDVLGADRVDQRRAAAPRAGGSSKSVELRRERPRLELADPLAQHRRAPRASSSGATPGPPTPTSSSPAAARSSATCGDCRPSDKSPAHVSARSIPSSASSRIAPWPRRIIGEPIRDIPFSVCTEARVTWVSSLARPQPDLDPGAAQVAGERRALQLLLPDVALALGRAEAAVVGPHAAPLGGLQHLGPLAALAAALALDVLDPRRSAATSAAGCRGRRRASRPPRPAPRSCACG